MNFCYVDESGTSQIPGNSNHFILAGLSIPIMYWKSCDLQINNLKKKFALENNEIHVAWILRSYLEQSKIADFDNLSIDQRKSEVHRLRVIEIYRLQKSGNSTLLKQTKKNFEKTKAYSHLNLNERRTLVLEIAKMVSKWKFARLFAECVDKTHFDPTKTSQTIDEQSFEQVISRYEQYLRNSNPTRELSEGKTINFRNNFGIIVHDNNETVAKKHTELMKKFHQHGTFWTDISNIIETPFFVDSQLTSMVQIADICAYALRRYLENGEEELFDLIFERADRVRGAVVGVRHFTRESCSCKICVAHHKK
jgi:hypothetical protein